MNQTDPEVAAAARRVAGTAALRRIRHLVDAEIAVEDWKSRWSRRIAALAVLLGIVIVLWGTAFLLR